MNTYHTHTQLATALRALAELRQQLATQRLSWLERSVCQLRCLGYQIRVRQLIDRLHRR